MNLGDEVNIFHELALLWFGYQLRRRLEHIQNLEVQRAIFMREVTVEDTEIRKRVKDYDRLLAEKGVDDKYLRERIVSFCDQLMYIIAENGLMLKRLPFDDQLIVQKRHQEWRMIRDRFLAIIHPVADYQPDDDDYRDEE